MKKEEIDDIVDFIFDGGYNAINRLNLLLIENRSLKRELTERYKGIEQLNNVIHKAILELERYENDREANYYAPIKETLDILRGSNDNE